MSIKMQVADRPQREISFRLWNVASAFALAVVFPTVTGILYYATRDWDLVRDQAPQILFWLLLVGFAEMLPAPAWRGMHVSLSFPILTAVAITLPPGAAAMTAFLGSIDPREFRREVSFLKALFNRSQVALAVLAASSVFHSLADIEDQMAIVALAAVAASLVDYAVNLGLVASGASLMYRIRFLTLLRQLPRLQEFLISYVGLGVIGAVLAKLYSLKEVGFWSVVVVVAPLLFARQMFMRSHALEEAHVELQEREEILRALSNAMAEERADERLQIAGYLHDDLAQVLFRLSIQVDVARKLLDKQDLAELQGQLEKIRDSKQETSDRVRALIRDLHRSPLGAKGLAESIESFTDEVGGESGTLFHNDVHEIDLPAPIALLLYHITREAVMNALKHAQATDMWIRVIEEDADIVLELRDNGKGFDATAPGPEGHFGMAMMRERAQIGGGTLEVESEPGKGTEINVRFPVALLQRDARGTEQASANTGGNASPDTKGTTPQEDEGSRDSVPA
jgi:signal transduction histidine kinase